MLLRWFRAQFPSHPVPEETIKAMSTHSSWDTHNRITDLFLGLARQQHSEGIMNPDVQIGLGVLFYTNGEYDRAKDCFQSALVAKPKVQQRSFVFELQSPLTVPTGLPTVEQARLLSFKRKQT